MSDFNALVALVVERRAKTDALAVAVERTLVALKQAEFDQAAAEAALDRAIRDASKGQQPPQPGAQQQPTGLPPVARMVDEAIRRAIAQTGGIRAAARVLGLPPSTVWDHAKRLGISRKRGV